MSLMTAKAQSESALPSQVVLTPYIVNDAKTPRADKVLLDKLDRIVVKYGVGANNGTQSPFIITAHAIELDKETTATVPQHIAVKLSLTFYIGNGEENVLFSTCNMEVSGVGDNTDQAYASAFRKINVNSPELLSAVAEGKSRISEYYRQQGPALIKKAKMYQTAGDYAEAFNVLLRIPPVCPQYNEAQNLLIEYVARESDDRNNKLIARARAAWSASPDERGASEAASILSSVTNASPTVRKSMEALSKEMGTGIQKNRDREAQAELAERQASHQERMAVINGAAKVAAAYAKRPVYRIVWW